SVHRTAGWAVRDLAEVGGVVLSSEEYLEGLLETYGDEPASAAELLCDRHPADAVASTVVEPDLSHRNLTFGERAELSGRFAAGLAELGVGRGDRVATLMGRSAGLVIALVGLWRLGAIHVPLFTAFAPPAIALRTLGTAGGAGGPSAGAAKVIITD